MLSPGCKLKFIANNITRVCRSAPKVTGAVMLNGSCCCVTESKAIARVEVSWLISTGAFDCAFVFLKLMGVKKIESTQVVNAITILRQQCEPKTMVQFDA